MIQFADRRGPQLGTVTETFTFRNGVSISLQLVTPDIAHELLSCSAHHRPIRPSYVADYTQDMADGNWLFTGETIIINKDGKLDNGQHRLSAIIKSGCPQDLLIVRGIDPDAFVGIDTGHKHSHADTLKKRGVKQAAATSGTCRSMYTYLHSDGRTLHGASFTPTNAQLDKTRDQLGHDTVRRAVQATNGVARFLGGSHSAWAAAHIIMGEAGASLEERASFFKALADGQNLAAGHPALALRNSLLKQPASQRQKGHDVQNIIFRLVISAWNSHRQGKPMHSIRLSKTEKLPKPL